MKRWLAKIVVFLLLGAVVNVAVAWGCAIWSTPPTGLGFLEFLKRTGKYWGEHKSDRLRLESIGWKGSPESASVGYRLFAMANVGPGLVRREIQESPVLKSGEGGCMFATEEAFETLAGWPCLAFRGLVWNQAQRGELDRWRNHLSTASPFRNDQCVSPEDRRLPLGPIWSGFVVNTLLYAALPWLLFGGSFQIRRFIRRRHGHCIKCGYDLRGDFSAGCPECGADRSL